MSDKINIAIVGYGNVGRGVHQALSPDRNPDMSLAGIVTRRNTSLLILEDGDARRLVCNSIDGLAEKIDVAILCGGSKEDLPAQGTFYASRFNTIDSFDTHNHIPPYKDEKGNQRLGHFAEMDLAARATNHVSVISAGWDPGTFSVERVLANAFIPGSINLATYGLSETGGLSMGHSDAIRTIPGVKDARQYTHAKPEPIEEIRKGNSKKLFSRDKMWRECFVVLETDTPEERTRVSEAIKTMPDYFKPYDTQVKFVSEEELRKNHSAMPHDGLVLTVGKTGSGNRAMIEYRNKWKSNPEATGSILVACARACYRLSKEGRTGAFTMLDIPPSHYSPHSRAELLKDFM